uniref:Uncharacterized protein LOC100178885 n=1 Tax=Phallusia mammillata TaxID=59560 RepID=A0A6F9DGZ6_9ASCI|nr:uncharacterized protein LOC100178885 [Phallusia mammillata]
MRLAIVVIYATFFVETSKGQNTTANDTPRGNLEDIMFLFPNRSLAQHELVCLKSHNEIRKAHGLNSLRWHQFFSALADSRAIHLMYSDLPFIYNEFARRYLKEGELSYVHTTRQVKVYLNRRNRNISAIVAAEVNSILRQWYLDGVFDTANADENYLAMLDPRAISFGCVVRLSTINSTTQKLYFVVAYRKVLRESDDPTDWERMQRTHLTPLPDRTCSISCPPTGSCISHNISYRLVSRVGGLSPTREPENCVCLPEDNPKPFCRDSCYVMCPLATGASQRACYGRFSCSCSNGNAVCY